MQEEKNHLAQIQNELEVAGQAMKRAAGLIQKEQAQRRARRLGIGWKRNKEIDQARGVPTA